jgi:hypothetical protein
MKFYLRVVNPVIALIVFILCFWAATAGDDKFSIFGIVLGGMSTYFFAKGIFTSLSLLILGRILLEIIYYSDKSNIKTLKNSEIIYFIAFGIFTIGSLVGLLLLSNADKFSKDDKPIENPIELKVSDIHRIKESEKLKFSGTITNLKESEWKDIELTANLYINGKLSDKDYYTIPSLKINKSEDFLIEYDEFNNSNVSDSVIVINGLIIECTRFKIKMSKSAFYYIFDLYPVLPPLTGEGAEGGWGLEM